MDFNIWAPRVMAGTYWPSIMSRWMRSAVAMLSISDCRFWKFASRIDGAIFMFLILVSYLFSSKFGCPLSMSAIGISFFPASWARSMKILESLAHCKGTVFCCMVNAIFCNFRLPFFVCKKIPGNMSKARYFL